MAQWRHWTTSLVLAALALAVPAAAQRVGPARRGAPAFGVAQINVADGDVRILQPNGDKFRAVAGEQVRPGDRILTGPRSRAEIQLSRGNLARLDASSELRIEGLGNRAYRLDLIRGVVHYSQLREGQADVDIETAVVSVQPIKPSVFSVEALPDGRMEVNVRKGAVEVFSDRGVDKVKKGRSLSVRSVRDETSLQVAKADPKTNFDDWSKRRNKMLQPPVRYQGFGPYWGGFWSPTWGPYWGSYWGRGFGGYWGPPYRRSVVVVHGRGRR